MSCGGCVASVKKILESQVSLCIFPSAVNGNLVIFLIVIVSLLCCAAPSVLRHCRPHNGDSSGVAGFRSQGCAQLAKGVRRCTCNTFDYLWF